MIITLKSYLASLEVEERAKPEGERRPVPSITALATDINIGRVQLQRIAGGGIKHLDLDTGGLIIAAMRRRGFLMKTTDLVDYRE